jgi:hypothetical protein
MSISFKEILDRYNFFSAGNDEPSPSSITSPIQRDYASDQNYDINFEQTLREKFADDATAVGFGSMNYITWLSQAEHSKDTRTQQYREMEQNGFVSSGLDEIVYSAINEDEHGESLHLRIKNKGFEDNDNIRENLHREFKHIKDSVLKYDENFTTLFREYVLMGELALEYLIPHDNEEIRTKGILGVKMLLSEEFVPIYSAEGKIDGFVVKNPWDASTRLLAEKRQFAYVDSGKYDFVDGNGPAWAKQYIPNQSQNKVLRLVRSFMEEARKPYKQLDALEDSLVIYRLSRAPERLIFNVATGNLPKNRAEQYLQKIMNKYRKKLTYNAETGSVDQAQNVKNIMEDYWFVKDNQGKGTDVTSLASGGNLGEIEDVNYFLTKLYRAMKVPLARLTGESAFEQSVGMNREEIKFEKYIYWIVQKFVQLVKQVYKTHLQLKGIWDHYQMKDEDIAIVAVPPSYFSYMKNSEVLEAQFTRFANFSNNIDAEEPIFSKRMALKEGLGWSDEKIEQNRKWLDEEKAASGGEEEEEMGGGLGGEGEGGGEEAGGGEDLGL